MTDIDSSAPEDASVLEWPPKLTLDNARILALLTGDRFYSSKDAALREAALNAIDACTRREALDHTAVAEISIEFDDANRTVTVSDNGDGMGKEDVARLFSRIGASMANVATDVESVGEFGVGVVSYFLVCDEFELQSSRINHDPVGLRFSTAMLDAETPSMETPTTRSASGTTLDMYIRDQATYELLVERFPHWCREVQGLIAVRQPGERQLSQGRAIRPATEVAVDLPSWAESAHLGPPAGFDRWAVLDGRATVDILYRGVYVETQTIDRLWGMEGSIAVHPKQLKPRLNREGFLAEELRTAVLPFLEAAHPAVLHAGLASLVAVLDDPTAPEWSVQRLVGLWLAVPRSPAYAGVVAEWDAIFRAKKLFRQLISTGERDISLNEVRVLPKPLYVAPDGASSDLVRAATRVLVAGGASVLRGVSRDQGFMSQASFVAQSTAGLLLSQFGAELEPIISVESVAEQILRNAVRVAEMFSSEPRVALVQLGADGAPIARVASELWINLDTDAGRAVVQDVCSQNRGRESLLVACHMHAQQHIGLVAGFVRPMTSLGDDRLGLVKRQQLRGLAS